MYNKINQFDFLKVIGLVEETNGIWAVLPTAYAFYKDEATVKTLPLYKVKGFEPASSDDWNQRQYSDDAYRLYRIRLQQHTPDVPSNTDRTFEVSKVVAVIDIDTHIDEKELLSVVEKFPIKPTFIHKTYKGWHLIFVAKEWLSFEELMKANQSVLKAVKNSISFPYEWIKPTLATDRVINEELFCYYTGSYFNEAIETDEDIEDTYLTLSDITLNTIDIAYQSCQLLQKLDNEFSTHSYKEWETMAYYYALRHILGDEKARQVFIDKSKLYPNYKTDEIIKQFDYELNWIKQVADQHGAFLRSCKSLQITDTTVCEMCKVYPKHVFLYATKQDWNLPTGYTVKDDTIYKHETTNDGVVEIKVCSSFLPLAVVKTKTDLYLAVKYKGETRLWAIRYTASGNINLSYMSEAISIYSPKRFASLVQALVPSLLDEGKVIKLEFLGLKSIWNEAKFDLYMNVAGINVPTTVVNQALTGSPEMFDFIPATTSKFTAQVMSEFKEIFEAFIKNREYQSLVVAGHMLSQFNYDYVRQVYALEPRPVVIFRGETSAGKTLRLKLLLSLFGYPKPFSFQNTTDAYIRAKFPLFKAPIVLDEIVLDSPDRLRDFIYFVSNTENKRDMEKVVEPITSPVVLAGESRNFPINSLRDTGLIRRIIPLSLNQPQGRNINKLLVQKIPFFMKNMGTAYSLHSEFQDTEDIDKFMKSVDLGFNEVFYITEAYTKMCIYNSFVFSKLIGIDIDMPSYVGLFSSLKELFSEYDSQSTELPSETEEDLLAVFDVMTKMMETYYQKLRLGQFPTLPMLADAVKVELRGEFNEIARVFLCSWSKTSRNVVAKFNLIAMNENWVETNIKREIKRIDTIKSVIKDWVKEGKLEERRLVLHRAFEIYKKYLMEFSKTKKVDVSPILTKLNEIYGLLEL